MGRYLMVLVSVLAGVQAQDAAMLAIFGSGSHDAAIPTPLQILGFELGSRVSSPEEVARYASMVAAVSDRVKLVEIGKTVRDRPLLHVLVSSSANLERIATIAAAHRDMLERGVEAAPDLPVHVVLGMSVHGNEPSGVEAGLGLLWHLASSTSKETTALLESVVIEIALDMNPDGRARFSQGLRDRGQWVGEERAGSFAHTEGWPSGRGNGNWFDMNRDWHLQTQPESRARVARCVQHPPQVIGDFHEMGSDDGYYAATPAGPPRNMLQTAQVSETLAMIGEGIVAAQEARGQSLWSGDRFPADFPGYGGAWGAFSGAACLTLEQAGSGAGRVQRSDGSVLTLSAAAANHAATALAMLESSAAGRQRIHQNFAAHSRHVREAAAREESPTYLLAPGTERGSLRLLAETLQRNGIALAQLREAQNLEVRPLTGGELRAESFPAGTLVVSRQQARGLLVSALLDPRLPLDEAFSKAEAERESNQQKLEQYDMSAWCMPLLFGVQCWRGAALSPERLEAWAAEEAQALAEIAEPLAWVSRETGARAISAAVELLQKGVRLRYAPFEFVADGKVHSAGSIVALAERNPEATERNLLQAAVKSGWMRPLRSGITEQGHDVGSWRTRALLVPKIVLLTGEDTDSASAGAAGWVLHTVAGLPVVRARVGDLERALESATVLVMPDGRYGKGVSKDLLESFLGRGGVVIAFAGAAKFLSGKECGLLNVKPVKDLEAGDSFNGVVVKTMDFADMWLTHGLQQKGAWLLRGDALFARPDADSKAKMLLQADCVESGSDSQRLHPKVSGLPLLLEEPVKRGRIVAFCSDPCLRGANPAAWRPLFNAILLGPGLARD